MMEDAKHKKFEKVVVKDVSRFARNTVDLLQSVRDLKAYGVQVDFLNNGEVMEGGSEFILTILGAMAQQESANMSKRVKFGKDITAQKGRVPNLVFGYDKIPNERYTLKIYVEVRDSAYEIINRKKATYYGIGLGLARIVKNILNDTNEILTVSAYLDGEYGQKDIYIGTPAIINSNGAREILELDLSLENQKKLDKSCSILTEYMDEIRKVIF